MSAMESVTCTGPVNIAVVKYWGKRDEKLILPVNSSLSATLDQEQLRSKTTVAVSRSFTKDRMWLNGIEQKINSERLQNVIREIRRRARKRSVDDDNGLPFLDWHIHICSENNFPTAAGLASSAAGYACLVFTLAKLYRVDGDISEIARQGSGSACRSIYGGFVAWDMGTQDDGSDSVARQVTSEQHWDDMRVLILVVSTKKKHIGSTDGMQTSVKTSELLKSRTRDVVPSRMDEISRAIIEKDYQTFAEETMKDSNQMHAVCLDTYPPISYMTDVSRDIIRIVHAVNSFYNEARVCYTFDAGPNACLYLPKENVPLVLAVMKYFFPETGNNGETFVRGIRVEPTIVDHDLLGRIPVDPNPGAIQFIISTKVGPGPQVLNEKESLLDETGVPISVAGDER